MFLVCLPQGQVDLQVLTHSRLTPLVSRYSQGPSVVVFDKSAMAYSCVTDPPRWICESFVEGSLLQRGNFGISLKFGVK